MHPSWNPLPMKVIHVAKVEWSKQGDDECSFLGKTLGLKDWQIRNLAEEINTFPQAHVRNLRFLKEEGVMILKLNLLGDSHQADFGSLSGAEQEIVLMEFATAAARLSARYCPTLLVLDHPFMALKNWFEFYEHHLLYPVNQFQTLMCTPYELDLEKAHWSGWNVIILDRTFGSKKQTTIIEEPKPKQSPKF
jgi:hypothetical protein